ncbi:MAG: hypothetical protein A2817_00200 [Candidatus Yanofskybacteria bacterium RIFCSPHIGHO2_01_FULL_39_8b]|uniref:GtrA/DPMS transmembrane domain-containing protein n=1 Tax=Candidatus Yanofskybacteria bacterium RIFCSPHIGHO2_01_FULL_39_8b TaxID=1802659 RepID=A0A1F8EDA8_9BACT|nr:MAG: hypothetical protein A2817_00200 [Candidatus Yanofskybacteria bacterium RIFCSPHIGHO2_01_FULL_39_8b]
MFFTKKDFISSIITGFYTGLIAWRVFVFIEKPDFFGISLAWLIVFVPVLWVLGVNLGYFLGKWMPFFNQFGKYAAVGFTNAAVDFGVLNLLIAYSGIASGFIFSIFKGASFIIAVTHSYFWNKYWAFQDRTTEQKGEFFKFFVVNTIVAAINIGTASFVVNSIEPQFGLDTNVWANIGAVIGSAVALIFNFIGFRLVVFKGSSQKLEQ